MQTTTMPATTTYEAPTIELREDWAFDESEAGPIVVIGAAALALIAAYGGAVAAASFLCRDNGGVRTMDMSYFPNPSLKVECNVG
jgi:hypothetical protein